MTEEEARFEDDVRRIARLLWPGAEYGGAGKADGQEYDGKFETPDFVYFVECTVSRRLDKAEKDAAKLDKRVRHEKAKDAGRLAKGWFITLHEPTADQRDEVRKYGGRVEALSFDQFRSKLVNARSYLELRRNYPFGSIRDPKTNLSTYNLDYVPLDILDSAGGAHPPASLAGDLQSGSRLVLTGDYGAGKSATAREIFLHLSGRTLKGETHIFPVLLNLRDHYGQTNPVEALERHARNVGFERASSLVQAWRAGFCVLMLDGFDEIASAGWASTVKRLRDLRYRSMELVRRFVCDTPPGSGILITGRGHFFDSEKELNTALGLNSHFARLVLAELGAEQVKRLLGKWHWHSNVPSWLPTRPLLLSYLAANGLLESANDGDTGVGPAEGWDELLERIAAREAEIGAGIDADAVRRLIEGLATIARATADGLGPIASDAIVECFKTVCGFSPDDSAAVLLQRLPGLGAASSEDGARVFVDGDFVEAAKAGDVFRFIQDPFGGHLDSDRWLSTMRGLGAEVASHRCAKAGYDSGKISSAIETAAKREAFTLAADTTLVLCSGGRPYSGHRVFLKEVLCEEIVLPDQGDLSELEFQDCFVVHMELGSDVDDKFLPLFRRCHIGRIEGRAGAKDLPASRFVECEVDEFEHATDTTSAIMALPIPAAARATLAALKKLYVQSGHGRKETALLKGLDAQARAMVGKVMQLLRREGFAVRTRESTVTIWLPVKDVEVRKRALPILKAPTASKDALLAAARELA